MTGTADRPEEGRWKTPALAALLVLGFIVSRPVSTALMSAANGMGVIWLPSAFLAASLLLLPRRWAIGAMAFSIGSIVVIDRLADRPLQQLALQGVVFLLEPLLLVWLARRYAKGRWLTSMTRTFRLVVFAILPTSIAASLAITGLGVGIYGWEAPMALLRSFMADFLGMSVMLTSILVLGAPRKPHDPPGAFWAPALITAGITALSAVPFLAWGFPSGLLMMPAMAVFAFRYGPKATVLSSLTLTAATICLSLFFPHPLIPGSTFGADLSMLQQLSAGLFFLGLGSAMAFTHHRRLKAHLERRTELARLARIEALRASKAKTDFLATMSHEIRTPMNAILGFTQLMLRDDEVDDASRRNLNLIDRAGGALLTVVNDILDFSQVEAGELKLSIRPVQMRTIAEDCLAIVAESARVKGLSLDLSVDGPAERHHLADDQRVRQVLLNLLNNAIKFTEAGLVGLRLEVIPGAQADQVRFSVADTGPGIPPEGVERLFKRFSQADSTISRTHGGTGLGLAICKNLVELMDGEIGVESELDKGSTFWFELPLQHAQSTPAAIAATAGETGLIARVLLVDDHPMNRELGAAVLGLLGCEVDLAEDGAQAIEAMSRRRYDAVLMDIHMPVMNGLEATRAIRALGGDAGSTPIIAMSADVMPEQMDLCRQAGMVDSVPKPIRIERMHEALGRWVGVRIEAQPQSLGQNFAGSQV